VNELLAKSESRDGAPVLWEALHTAEGPGPAAGGVESLVAYFTKPGVRASCHAAADDTKLREGLVPYDRAAWTLRAGSRYSDNLEMCGYAGWTRAMWLRHLPMVRHAARWAALRCRARGILPRRLTVHQVAERRDRGIIDHNTYTVATGDGTHWDIGPNFPWDVFLPICAAEHAALQSGGLNMADADDIVRALGGLTSEVRALRETVASLQRATADIPRSAELYAFGEHGKAAVYILAGGRTIHVPSMEALHLWGLTGPDVHWLPAGDALLAELRPEPPD